MKSRTLLLFFAVILLVSAAFAAVTTNGNLQQQSSQTYMLSARGTVSLENINGNVHVHAWDRDEVRVDAVKTTGGPEPVEEARVVVDSNPEAISIRTHYAGDTTTNLGAVEYTVNVPRRASLVQIKLINGELDIDGVIGEVNASSVNGTVRASGIAGDARLSTVNGKLEAAFEKLGDAKRISMNSVNGSIVLSIPYDAGAEFNARNVTGGIDNDFGMQVNRGQSAGSQMHGVLKGGGTHIDLQNVNGSICILPVSHGRRVRFM